VGFLHTPRSGSGFASGFGRELFAWGFASRTFASAVGMDGIWSCMMTYMISDSVRDIQLMDRSKGRSGQVDRTYVCLVRAMVDVVAFSAQGKRRGRSNDSATECVSNESKPNGPNRALIYWLSTALSCVEVYHDSGVESGRAPVTSISARNSYHKIICSINTTISS
jgi:hypothetical protein